MAKRRTYKRDRRGRFASTGSTRVNRIRRKINRRRPRYVRGKPRQDPASRPRGPWGRIRGRPRRREVTHKASRRILRRRFGRPQNCDAVLAVLAHQLEHVAEGFESLFSYLVTRSIMPLAAKKHYGYSRQLTVTPAKFRPRTGHRASADQSR